jgi:hypothetical protein
MGIEVGKAFRVKPDGNDAYGLIKGAKKNNRWQVFVNSDVEPDL